MDSYQQLNKHFTPKDHNSIIKSQITSTDSRNSSKEVGQQQKSLQLKQLKQLKHNKGGQQQQQQENCLQFKQPKQKQATTTRRLPAAIQAAKSTGAHSKQHNKQPTVTKSKVVSTATRKHNPFKKMSDWGDEETAEVGEIKLNFKFYLIILEFIYVFRSLVKDLAMIKTCTSPTMMTFRMKTIITIMMAIKNVFMVVVEVVEDAMSVVAEEVSYRVIFMFVVIKGIAVVGN